MTRLEPIAIVGAGAVLPASDDLAAFWGHVRAGRDVTRELPAERWALAPDRAFDPRPAVADHVYSLRGGVVERTDFELHGLEVDAASFASLDPSVQLALVAGRDAWAQAVTTGVDRARVGVILGNIALPTERTSALTDQLLGRRIERALLGRVPEALSAAGSPVAPINRWVTGLPASLLARALGLGGNAFTLDAACASSLFALERSVDELQSGRADVMLTGGLSRPDSLYTQMGFSQLRALSPRGTCSPFDAAADGLVVGEGAGVVVLKRLSDALAAGDKIRAIIRGIGISNDVDGNLLAPSEDGQLRAMRAAYHRAGWTPGDVDLIECHATGTPVGDRTEYRSLRALWGEEGWSAGQCVIGSVKSNVGHLLTGAGAVGLLKVLLAFEHAELPPTANFHRPHPEFDLAEGPFRILSEAAPWPRPAAHPRRAAVSGFGFGGTNAHVLLEHWEGQAIPETTTTVTHDVAVVGADVALGPWRGLEAFERRLLGAEDSPTPTTTVDGAIGPVPGYFMDALELPFGRFRIPPRELAAILPQQSLMLDVAHGALADAALGDFDHLRAGVFVGIGLDLNTTRCRLRWVIRERAAGWADALGLGLSGAALGAWTDALCDAASPALDADRTMGGLGGIVASRIAREFGLGGPSYVLSSDDGSGMAALEAAARAIAAGDLDVAVVGAIDLTGDLRQLQATDLLRPAAPDGVARPFDLGAEGTVHGEGAVCLVLQRGELVREGRSPLGWLRAVRTTTSGQPFDLVPTADAIAATARLACVDAALAPGRATLIVAHGSGVPAEDRVELAGLRRAFEAPRRAWLTAPKSAFGHAGAAQGLVSVLAGLIALNQSVVPPVRHLATPRRGLDAFLASPRPQPWLHDTAAGRRVLAVSALSTSGTAHVALLEAPEAPPLARSRPLGAPDEALFFAEGDDAAALRDRLAALRALASRHTDLLAAARDAFSTWPQAADRALAVALIPRSLEELARLTTLASDALSTGGNVAELSVGRALFAAEPLGPHGEVAFVYPGSGSQFHDMGRDLALQWPAVVRAQHDRTPSLRSQLVPELIWNTSDEALQDKARDLILAQVALGTLSTDVLRLFGVRPDAVIGYSLGETAGLFSMGVWTERDLMLRRATGSDLFTTELAGPCYAAARTWQLPAGEAAPWRLAVINRSAEAVRAALHDLHRAYLLIVNTPHECVVGGHPEDVGALIDRLQAHHVPLHGVTTVHCEVAGEVASAYRAIHILTTTPVPDVRFYSGCWGHAYDVTQERAADSILAQALHGVDYPAVVRRAWEDGVRIFVELGPGRSCTRMIHQILADRPHAARSVCVEGQSAHGALIRGLALLLTHRVACDLAPLFAAPPEAAVKPGRALRIPIRTPPPNLEAIRALAAPAGATAAPEAQVVPPPARHSEGIRASATQESPFKSGISKPSLAPVPAPAPSMQRPVAPTVTAAAALPAVVARAPAPTIAAPSGGLSPFVAPAFHGLVEASAERARAHDAWLRLHQQTLELATRQLTFQMQLAAAMPSDARSEVAPWPSERVTAFVEAPRLEPAPAPVRRAPPAEPPRSLDREQCMALAIGRLGDVLGPLFAEVDTFPTRVRLPDEPLMLVDRIVTIEGEPLSMTSGRIVTEHDVHDQRWYLDGGRIPTSIAIESGQADLFLSGWLGIDFQTRGQSVYRLLDARCTFHDELPKPGDTVRYDIRIERFFRQGDTWLFHFNFEGSVNGRPLMSMEDGCAGFFSQQELDDGKGIVKSRLEQAAIPGRVDPDFAPFAPLDRTRLDEAAVDAIRRGELGAAFGPRFGALPLRNAALLPDGLLRLVHRVTHIDRTGGRYGLGTIVAEADVRPDDWFLTCHFVDDMVMPGTLMYECCLHTLRIFLMSLGWVGEADAVVFQPIPGVRSRLKCRGQVLQSTRLVTYEIVVKELGYRPEPFAIVDALMYADGKAVVDIGDMTLRLTGTDRGALEALWGSAGAAGPSLDAAHPAFDKSHILAFANGAPSACFGAPYAPFDSSERFIARLPRPPYQTIDRVLSMDGAPFVHTAGVSCVAEVDLRAEDWHFAENRQRDLALSILLEMALQPCGFTSAYVGAALLSDDALHFRNLGGSATLHVPVAAATDVLRTRARLEAVSHSAGMIIHRYTFALHNRAGQLVYDGQTTFGFFSPEALGQQVGIRGVKPWSPDAAERAEARSFPIPDRAPLPAPMMRMVDHIDALSLEGGPHGLGYAQGSIAVDPHAWFFTAHFLGDPVWPGSLGLEALMQLLKVIALARWGESPSASFSTASVGRAHSWTYRGQIVPGAGRVVVDAVIKEADDDDQRLVADGFLTVDGKVIYQMTDFALEMIG